MEKKLRQNIKISTINVFGGTQILSRSNLKNIDPHANSLTSSFRREYVSQIFDVYSVIALYFICPPI